MGNLQDFIGYGSGRFPQALNIQILRVVKNNPDVIAAAENGEADRHIPREA